MSQNMDSNAIPQVIPNENRAILHECVYDVIGYIDSGSNSHIYKGICNQNAFRNYQIFESQAQTMASMGTVWRREQWVMDFEDRDGNNYNRGYHYKSCLYYD